MVLDLQQAISLLEKGRAEDAARLLEEMVSEMPAYATARVLLARSYEAIGQWNRALNVWRDALHLIPNSPVIRRGLERAISRSASRSALDVPRSRAVEEPPILAEPPRIEPEPPEIAEPPRVEEEPPPLEEEAPYPEPDLPRQFTYSETDAPDEPEPYEAEEHADHFHVPESEEHWTHIPAEGEKWGGAEEPQFEDLDRLITELESARIVPRPDMDTLPAPDLEDDIEDVVSETLARIYASQGQYDEAARVYELLAGQQPEKAGEFMKKASEMRARASD